MHEGSHGQVSTAPREHHHHQQKQQKQKQLGELSTSVVVSINTRGGLTSRGDVARSLLLVTPSFDDPADVSGAEGAKKVRRHGAGKGAFGAAGTIPGALCSPTATPSNGDGSAPARASSQQQQQQQQQQNIERMLAAGTIDSDDLIYARLPSPSADDGADVAMYADLAGGPAELERYASPLASPLPRPCVTSLAQHAALKEEYTRKHEVYIKVGETILPMCPSMCLACLLSESACVLYRAPCNATHA